MRKTIRYGSVCSGIEAATSAWKPIGWKCEFVAEIEPFPKAALKHHYPETPNHGDITKFKEWPNHTIDVLIGGTPCQSFSVAGLRAGLSDPRGNLALTFLAITDRYRPRWVLWENVPGVHSSWTDEAVRPPTEDEARMLRERGLDPGEYEYAEQTNDFDCFLSGLEKLGYGVATAILDAQYFGVAQRRERVFVVGHIGGEWQRAAAVLFDTTCLRGNPAPRREKGESVADTFKACAGSGGWSNSADHASAGYMQPVERAIAPTLSARTKGDGKKNGTDPEALIIAPALTEASGNARPGDNIQSVGYLTTDTYPIQDIDRQNGERKQGGSGFGNNGDPSYTLQAGSVHGVAHTLRANHDASEDGTGRGTPIIPIGIDGGEVGFALRANGSHPGDKGDGGMNQTTVVTQMAVRRLTPRECERLQGFPDDYTLVPYNGKPAKDGPRYKALGNSMAVPCIEWLGQRIELVDGI